MIANLEREEFAEILDSLVTPSSSAPAGEFFRRDPQVREIERALGAPGRTVFIYGEFGKGKGKNSPAQIVAALQSSNQTPGNCAVVIEQFDQIASEMERTRFAAFIKQTSDRSIPIRFFGCGVSEAVKKLLGAHESCYLMEDMQPSSPADASLKIREALEPGSPHYVYLLSEKLFWEMFSDPTFAGSLR
jgi:hypothetical protein